jgi:hypothetical protein
MGKLLQFIWLCKVILTGGTAYRYCSENPFSPFCGISAFYSFALFVSIFLTCKKRNGYVAIEEQETLHLQYLEEGLGMEETIVSIKQDGPIYSFIQSSKREWENAVKEKYS